MHLTAVRAFVHLLGNSFLAISRLNSTPPHHLVYDPEQNMLLSITVREINANKVTTEGLPLFACGTRRRIGIADSFGNIRGVNGRARTPVSRLRREALELGAVLFRLGGSDISTAGREMTLLSQ